MYTGLGAVLFFDPPSGSTIANFEGTVNFTTITCNISNSQGTQISTQWTIANFRGVSSQVIGDNLAPKLFIFSGDQIPTAPSFTYRNRLTLSTLDSDLDQVIIFCGSGINPQQANVIVRIYRKCSELGLYS